MNETRSAPLRILIVDDGVIDRRLAGGIVAKQLGADVAYAADGTEALAAIAQSVPDLVLTDLQMPALDGLELVREIRRLYPALPTVLMTAHGSEEIAIAALQAGAANYVPKRNLAEQLPATLRDVLALVGSGRDQRRLFAHWSSTRFEFHLENDASIIPLLVNHLQQYASGIRTLDETERLQVSVALHEAIRNAMHHGNLELSSELRLEDGDAYYLEAERRRFSSPYGERRVYVCVEESPAETRYCVRDEGPGFDVSRLDYDPTDPANIERTSGRGIFLIRTFMSETIFNERGNELTMIHRRTPESSIPG